MSVPSRLSPVVFWGFFWVGCVCWGGGEGECVWRGICQLSFQGLFIFAQQGGKLPVDVFVPMSDFPPMI